MDEYEFLTLDDVLDIHERVLAQYGGLAGFIDQNAVESAIAQPSASMFGEYLHDDITKMAAAYLFHLASQQGFCDGNKRTAVVAAVEFLGRNGYKLTASDWEVYLITMRIADPGHAERITKDGVADWILDRLEPQEYRHSAVIEYPDSSGG